MSEKKGWGRTVMGWFVQDDSPKLVESKKDESVDDLIAKYASDPAAAGAPIPVKLEGDVPRATGGKIDLPRVYAAAGVSEEEQGRITKALDLLQTLPPETPVAVKKQIVEASLKAFGYPIDQIIEAGVQEIQALEAYIQHESQETQRTLTEASAKIEDLTNQIAELRKLMQVSMDEQNAATAASNAAKLQIQQVLEFFGQEAVAKVVKESPKLHEPPAPKP